jgi:hypothetical protein|tara:strand:- start:583 stop:843 length:261 start_codon:yes stop_codon:yes gene_type:complete
MYLHSTSYTLKVIIFLSSQERVSNDMPSWEERFVRRKLCSPQKVIFFIDRKNDIVFVHHIAPVERVRALDLFIYLFQTSLTYFFSG